MDNFILASEPHTMRSSGGLLDGVLDAGLWKDDIAPRRHMVAETMRGI